MSKKDQLGRGSSFGSAASAVSARRGAIEQTIHGGGASPAALTDLPVPVISDNPDNPRNHLRNLDDTVESVREVGVILPIVVATIDAYLRGRPDRAGDVDDGAQYVVVDGHRRLEAARRAGLATIPVRVDDAYVTTDERLLEAAFIANYHREGMTELEEAHALKQLVEYYGGSQTKACKRLAMSASTLSSKLSLLKLSPELQKDLQTGERRVEHVRNLGKLSPEAQKAKADERAAAAREKAQARVRPVVAERSSGPADFHGVKSNRTVTSARVQPEAVGADSQSVADPMGYTPVDEPPDRPVAEPVSRPEVIPEPRESSPSPEHTEQTAPTKMFPYNDGKEAGNLILFKMPPEERDKLAEMLLRDREKRVANAG